MLKNHIKEIIQSKEAFCVELFGLMIYRDENDNYLVNVDIPKHKHLSKKFRNADAAIEEFFFIKNDLKLGFDQKAFNR